MPNTENNSNKTLYRRLLIRCAILVACAVIIVFVVPKAIKLLLPFVIAFVVAALLNPLVNKINRKLGVSRRVMAVILDLLVFLVVFSLIGALGYTIVNEAISLATNIQSNWDSILAETDRIQNSFHWLIGRLPPQAMDILASLEESVAGFIQSSSKSIVNSIVAATTAITTKTGNFFVNFVIAILASYFVIADFNGITAFIKQKIGSRAGRVLGILKDSAFSALGGYLKSQLLLALFAFLFMLAALLFLEQPYALLIALFLGFIDLLPIVGTIAVLLPWGIVEVVSGDMNKGIYLIVVGVVFFLIRKIVEPKIVGSQTGLHPLAALMSTYVGLQFSGVWGAVLGPMVLMLIISIVKSDIFDGITTDFKAVAAHISHVLKPPGRNESDENTSVEP